MSTEQCPRGSASGDPAGAAPLAPTAEVKAMAHKIVSDYWAGGDLVTLIAAALSREASDPGARMPEREHDCTCPAGLYGFGHAPSCGKTEPDPHDMIRELRAVLRLSNSAAPSTPQQVWRETLDAVRRWMIRAEGAEAGEAEEINKRLRAVSRASGEGDPGPERGPQSPPVEQAEVLAEALRVLIRACERQAAQEAGWSPIVAGAVAYGRQRLIEAGAASDPRGAADEAEGSRQRGVGEEAEGR